MEEEERQRPTSLQSAKVCFEPMTVELSKFSRADGRRECYLPTGDPARAVQKVPLPSSHEQTKLGSTSLTKPFAQKADFVFEPIIQFLRFGILLPDPREYPRVAIHQLRQT